MRGLQVPKRIILLLSLGLWISIGLLVVYNVRLRHEAIWPAGERAVGDALAHQQDALQELTAAGNQAPNKTLRLPPEWRVEQKLSYVGVIVFPVKRRLLCTVPKAGCTVLRSFALLESFRVRLDPNDGANVSHIHPFAKRNLLQLGSFSDEQVTHMLESPLWEYAAVVRHPLTRLLSAYLDKVVTQQELWRRPLQNKRPESFPEFVALLEDIARRYRNNWDWVDEHWRPQSGFCLFRFLSPNVYDHVVKVENATALEELYVTMFGESGARWVQERRQSNAKNAHTSVHSHAANAKLREYVDENLARRIQRLYAEDYQRFGYDLWPPE